MKLFLWKKIFGKTFIGNICFGIADPVIFLRETFNWKYPSWNDTSRNFFLGIFVLEAAFPLLSLAMSGHLHGKLPRSMLPRTALPE